MKPAPFDYLRATSTTEALAALHQAGTDAHVLAGGQSLLPMLNMRLARPRLLIDIMRIPDWQRVTDDGHTLRIGAGVRQITIERRPDLPQRQPLLAAAIPHLGHTQTRSRGTICGSVAHADPSAELPLILTALSGTIHLRSHRHHRNIPAEAFFTGMMATARADNEIIEAISIPTARPNTGYAFREIARRHGDFAIIACAAVATSSTVRLAIGGVADRPAAIDLPADPASFDDALNDFAWNLEARDDLHATARYRRELVRRVGRAVMQQAMQCRS
jgi:2-furoyl-CoA dehydrogenase FAD binding subunit